MRLSFVVFYTLMSLGLVASVSAQDLRVQLHQLGQRACQQVLAGGMNGLAGRDFAAEVKQAGVDAVAYCSCVGRGFEYQTAGSGDEEPEVFMQRLLSNTLSGCLVDIDEAWVEEADVGELENFAYDEGDVHMCGLALDGGLIIPSFDPEQVKAQMQKAGQTQADLCTCSARYFSAGGGPLQEELANASNPTVVYASTMAGAINTCLLDKKI